MKKQQTWIKFELNQMFLIFFKYLSVNFNRNNLKIKAKSTGLKMIDFIKTRRP